MTFQEKTIQNPFRLFVVISVLFHLSLMTLLAIRWPVSHAVSHPKPIFVSVIDPAELSQIPIGKETILPPKPKDLPRGDLTALPRSMTVPQTGRLPSRPSSPPQAKNPPQAESPPAVTELEGPLLPTSPGPSRDSQSPRESSREAVLPTRANSPDEAIPSGSGPSSILPGGQAGSQPFLTPIPKGAVPGLPFADQKDLDKIAKVFTEKEMPKRDTVSINTDDLRYLSYMLRLKQRIELIWRYPPEAVAAGIHGDLLLNFTIRQDGQLTDVTLIQSSGYRVLDEEAIQAVRAAAPYAPLPESWHQDRITVTGNFIYYGSFRAIQ